MSDEKKIFPIDLLLKREFTRKQFLGLGVVAAASAFGITRIFKDIHGYAASIASPGFETEKGTLLGGAALSNDSSASGGSAVIYKSSSVTTTKVITPGDSLTYGQDGNGTT